VTVLLLSCAYNGKEFVRIGYYVNNDYTEEELQENPPSKIVYDKIQRSILADKPRVTRIQIPWYVSAFFYRKELERDTKTIVV
jgi:histone chaperone ASF1